MHTISTTGTPASRLDSLRRWMKEAGLTGFIVPRTDAHQNGTTAPHDECLTFLSGFTGSAGMILVLEDSALIFVDGRYQVQVLGEVDTSRFQVRHLHNEPPEAWLNENARAGWRIGVEPMLVNAAFHSKTSAALKTAGAELIDVTPGPFDLIWKDRPSKPLGQIRPMTPEVAGETSASKRLRIASKIDRAGAKVLVDSQPDNIAWLLNLRGSDVPMNPTPQSFLILDAAGGAEWFVDRRKLGNALTDFELGDVTIAEPGELLDRIKSLAGVPVLVDPDFTSGAVMAAIRAGGTAPVGQTSPITIAKANKNTVELDGMRDCHVHDGVALTNFLAWLDREVAAREVGGDPITELEAQAKLLAFRSECGAFLDSSFETISAAGANAAMCHYHSTPQTDAVLTTERPYLVDSGGQYLNGTTDVTRTVQFGTPTPDMVAAYTAVLKGFIALISVSFPEGSFGHQLDPLARQHLWNIGLDYDHGTGHGVGHNLLVHEFPHRFAKLPNMHGLRPGNIMTIEPGYYRAGEFGMRIENLVEVVPAQTGFCRFQSMTLAPIDLTMADLKALSPSEIVWIDDYHASVLKSLESLVEPEAMAYLIEKTLPIAARSIGPDRN